MNKNINEKEDENKNKKKIAAILLLLLLLFLAFIFYNRTPQPKEDIVVAPVTKKPTTSIKENKKPAKVKTDSHIKENTLTITDIPEGLESVRVEILAEGSDEPIIKKLKPNDPSGDLSVPLLLPGEVNQKYSVKVYGENNTLLSKKDVVLGGAGTVDILLPQTLDRDSTTSPPQFSGLSTAQVEGFRGAVLKWTEATDNITKKTNIEYLIYRSEKSGGANLMNPTYTVKGASSLSVGDLKSGTKYYFIVRARDEHNNIENNKHELEITTPLIAPSALKLSVPTLEEVIISWSVIEDAKGFKVERRQANSKEYVQVADVAYAHFKDSPPRQDISYYYRVHAYNDILKSLYSQEILFINGIPPEVINNNRYGNFYTALTTDLKNGFPSMSYYNYKKTSLDVASYNGVLWDVVTVDDDGDVGMDSSIKIDTLTGHLRIAYYDIINRAFKYASFDGNNWNIETAITTETGAWGTFLVLDSKTGLPRFSYYEKMTNEVKIAIFENNLWRVEIVDKGSNVGFINAMAIDRESGTIYLTYYGDDSSLKIASFAGEKWNVEVVDTNVDTKPGASLALDRRTGLPSLSYFSSGSIKVASFNGESWKLETVDKGGKTGWDNAIALHPKTGYPVICYINKNDVLKIATFNGKSWDIKVINEKTDFISVDTNPLSGDLFLGYYDSASRNLAVYTLHW